MDIGWILIIGFLLVIVILYEIRKELGRIRARIEMTEQDKRDEELLQEDPDLYDDIMAARTVEKLNKNKNKTGAI